MVSQFDSDIQAIEPELPVVFIWKGKTLTGSRNATADTQALADAGIIQLYDVEIIVRVSAFYPGLVPSKNDDLTIQDPISKNRISYRIDSINFSQDGVAMTFGCKQNN